jgi:cob(I)alamin adenosyltransferase
MKGYVQVYTGDGKGKTTAALGLALRAAGAGLKVYIGQFMKTGDYSEINALKRFSDLITVEQFGSEKFIVNTPSAEDLRIAEKGLQRVRSIVSAGEHDVVVLDEANVALKYNLITVDAVLDIIRAKPDQVELVITGRYAHPKINEIADLVTEMKDVKHYFQKGVAARTGIEK